MACPLSANGSWNCFDCPVRRDGLFSELPEDQLMEIESSRTTDEYQTGHVLFYEGHHPLAVYCVVSGHLKLYQKGSNGKRHILRLAGPGELVGHEALLSRNVYEASAEAMDPCRVCILPGGRLLEVLNRNPPLLLKIIQHLEHDLQSSHQHFQDLVHRPVRERMARLLLDLSERFGRTVQGAKQLDLHLSRAEMADLIGTTPETAIRVLNLFKRRRLVSFPKAQSIALLDEPGIKALVAPSHFSPQETP